MVSFNRDNCTITSKVTSLTAFAIRTYEILAKRLKSYMFLFLNSAAIIKLAIVLFLTVLTAAVWHQWDRFTDTYTDLNSPSLGLFWLDMARALLFLNVAIFIWRVILVVCYRPCRLVEQRSLPTCTVIVPAYNEGRQVFDTLSSIVHSDYPASKLQIIAVDDGSLDDTWYWIQSAAERFEGRIETIKLEKNAGKRKALYEGFTRSTGKILVTIDSDSIIESQTLRRLVSPFVHDSKVGAVAGNVRVLNIKQGLIPKLLEISFAYSFDFTRASQSMVDTVFCTPGALSAYKRWPLMKNLESWLGQRFLGRAATIGEDRAMTNLIIRDGWKVKFQSDAVVYTTVPTKYIGLCKMFLRWARSNVRETIIMSTFIFSRFRRAHTSGARINFLAVCINLLMPRALVGVLLIGFSVQMQIYLLQLLAGASLWACAPAIFYALHKKSTDAIYAFAYAAFWLLALWWIVPYAMLTLANGGWLTRNLPAGKLQTVRQTVKVASHAAA